MLFGAIHSFLLLATAVSGLVIGESILKPSDDKPLLLPLLLHVKSIGELKNSWSHRGFKLDAGRLVSSGNAALWSTPRLPSSSNEWTIEFQFRSSGVMEDAKYGATNGLALWLDASAPPLPVTDNYGGPHKYDGFQVLVNAQEHEAVRLFNNDGSKKISNALEAAVGSCAFAYLDTLIPTTVRVSYLRTKKWFKIQVDNNLCFKLDEIVIPDNQGDFRFGITANTDKGSKEQYEILSLDVWPILTEDAIDDHGLMAGTEIQYVKAGKETLGSVPVTPPVAELPSVARKSVMEKQRESMQTSVINDQILRLLEKSDASIRALEEKVISNNKAGSQGVTTGNMVTTQDLDEVKKELQKFTQQVSGHFADLYKAMSKQHESVMREVGEQSVGFKDVASKVDFLMQHHQELASKYDSGTPDGSGIASAGIVGIIVKWILIPVMLAVVFLAMIVYRLRHDIKHSKLL